MLLALAATSCCFLVPPGTLPATAAAPVPLRSSGVVTITMQANDGGGDRFSQSTRLRGEVEDPFSKLRLFLWPALTAAAAIATYFGATSLLAEAAGLRPASGDALQNLAIDLIGLGGTGFLWRQEAKKQEKQLQRIAAGAALASLRVQPLSGEMSGKSIKLAELRSGRAGADDPFDELARRVVVCAAQEASLATCLESARASSRAIAEADLLVVPLLVVGSSIELPPPSMVVSAEGGGGVEHLALPQGVGAWQDVFTSEIEQALTQDATSAERGLTLILKKNGRVGTRRLGLPDWPSLVGDVGARAGAGLDTRNI